MDIIYLPKKDRDRLSDLSQLIRPLTEEETKEQEEILGRRKTLPMMTFSECQSMRNDLNEKVAKINAMGRVELSRNFIVMMNMLEMRMAALANSPRPKMEDANGNASRKTNPLARPRRSKWAVRVRPSGTDNPLAGKRS